MDPSYDKYLSNVAKEIKASDIRELLAVIRKKPGVISFAGGLPDPATFPKKEISELAKYVIEEKGDLALQYSETKGILEVREALSKFLQDTKNIRVDPEDIIITTGSQQAIDLVTKTFINPGDIVVTENPTYLASLGTFRIYGAKVHGITIDEHGIKTDLLEKEIKRIRSEGGRIKFIYVIPVAQNPSGVTMSIDRKKHLMEIASTHDLIIFEDDPYSYFIYDEGVDTTILKQLDKEGRVIYVSTISKIMAPGIRIGWIVSPPELTRRFELVKQYLDLHSPTLNQYILAEAINRGLLKNHISKLAPYYRVKRDAMIKSMDEYFSREETWYIKPVGGLFLMVYVYKKGFDASNSLPIAIEKYGVAYVPGASFHTDGTGRNSMRLNFSYPSVEKIVEGVKRLNMLIRETAG
uniref:PLP-dependent aminotransferase family protein n=1 Tax=Staphylothermus marinus TaxID=2280 RepID=A0A7C4NMV0_STAMA